MAEGWEAPDVPLPDTVRIGHIRFGKGVSLRTLVSAAARWHARACEAFQAKLEHRAAREAAMVERGGKLPPGWRRVTTGLYQHDAPLMLVRRRDQGDWWISASLRSPDGTVRSWNSYGYASARQAMVAGCGLLPAAERGEAEGGAPT